MYRSRQTIASIGLIGLISACAAVYREHYYLPSAPRDSQVQAHYNTSILVRAEQFSVEVSSRISRTMLTIGPVPLPIIPVPRGQAFKNETIVIGLVVSTFPSSRGLDIVPKDIMIRIPGRKELAPKHVSVANFQWDHRSVENLTINLPSNTTTSDLYYYISLDFDARIDDVEEFFLDMGGFTENGGLVPLPILEMRKGSVLSDEVGP